MRACALIALATLGCSDTAGGGGDDDGNMPPDPKGWTITVDMSGLNRFVEDGSTSWTVDGVATATQGLAGVDVAGAMVDVAGDGAFAGTSAVMPGLTRVPVLARDAEAHERKGDRSLLAARFLPEGDHNPRAAAIVLDDAILSAMSGGLVGQAGDVDIASEILARPILSQDDRCTTWPVEAEQGTVAVRLVEDRGNLWLDITVPDLYVYFEGECQGVFSIIPIGGQMLGTVDVWTQLTGKPPADGDCLSAFTHSTPEVEVSGWGFDVWGLGGPLQNWIVSLFASEKSPEARAQIQQEVGTRADTMLDDKLANVSVFDRSSSLELLDEPVAMHLCLGGLDKVGERLIARIAASAAVAEPFAPHRGRDPFTPRVRSATAPGAPQLDGAMPPARANELVLDANLVGQLLFASWRGGGLTRSAPDADISVLHVLVPELAEHYPSTTAQVTIDAELPPLVRATPGGPGDLQIEIGDLMLDLSVDGTRIFRFGVVLVLSLDLTATDGKLVPTVVASDATVALLDELYDGPDAALEQGVQLQVGKVAGQLIGENAAIALPDLPGLGTPIAVTAVDGRFLHVTLE